MNYMILDTETCPIDVEIEEVDPKNSFTYDFGWVISDEYGNVVKQRSFVNADIFLSEKELMANAFYADKIPQYWEDIKKKKRILTSFYNIRKAFINDLKQFGVMYVFAHNCRFDYGTLNTTYRWLTKSKFKSFFPYNVEICDILKLARLEFGKNADYRKFCIENDFMTKNNRVQLKAETIYRYLTQNCDFEESHTGLEDCKIEKEILIHCLKNHSIDESFLFPRVDEWHEMYYYEYALKK